MPPHSKRAGLTLLELLVVIAVIGILLGLLLSAVQRARDAVAATECKNRLKQIGIALHQYHDTQGSLPPGVSYLNGASPYPHMSWCTRLLPFVEQDALWREAQEAFAEERNFLVNPPHVGMGTVVLVFTCPADARAASVHVAFPIKKAFTSYLGVEGIDQYTKDGLLYLDSQVRFADVTDGTSNTLLVGERPPSADLVLGWWYAGWGQSQDGSADMVLGVRERYVSDYAPGCPSGPYQFGPGSFGNQCDAFHFWSPHIGGGAHFLLADGSVHFLTWSAAPVMPALATRAGGEPVSAFD